MTDTEPTLPEASAELVTPEPEPQAGELARLRAELEVRDRRIAELEASAVAAANAAPAPIDVDTPPATEQPELELTPPSAPATAAADTEAPPATPRSPAYRVRPPCPALARPKLEQRWQKLLAKRARKLVAAGVAVALLVIACTASQRQMAEPVVRAGGLVCLLVQDGQQREVCVAAHELAQAVAKAVAQQAAEEIADAGGGD